MTVCLFLLDSTITGQVPLLREITPKDGAYVTNFIPADMLVRDMSIIGDYVHVYLKRKEAA